MNRLLTELPPRCAPREIEIVNSFSGAGVANSLNRARAITTTQ
jgi:hypothetical protein